MKSKAIICDLDGTLCNTGSRQHHVSGEKKNWKAFNEECVHDKPNQWCVELIHAMAPTHEIIFITGRSLEYHEHTVQWLKQHIKLERYCLYMRPEKNFRPDTEIKTDLYKQFVEPEFDVTFCIEDRLSVVHMYRELGLTCLDCAGGEY
jgi:hydroxymethylpyrimidine pyrophosphatase-like HAD family hydrolase